MIGKKMLKNIMILLAASFVSMYSMQASAAIYYYYITDDFLNLCYENENPTYTCRSVQYQMEEEIVLIYTTKAKKLTDIRDHQHIIDECNERTHKMFSNACFTLQKNLQELSEEYDKRYTTREECEVGKIYIAKNGAKRSAKPGSKCD